VNDQDLEGRHQDARQPGGYWRQPVTWYDWLLYVSVAVLIMVIEWRLV
jgi:hypothetical protein